MDPRDELYWLAYTVLQESSGEPWAGQLAVAWVIVNRAKRTSASISDTVLAPLQFSCWNTASPTRARIDIDGASTIWHNVYSAACAAYFGLRDDPTTGATQYLNVEETKRIRKNGTLPAWAADAQDATKVNAAAVTAVIGRHTFMRAA